MLSPYMDEEEEEKKRIEAQRMMAEMLKAQQSREPQSQYQPQKHQPQKQGGVSPAAAMNMAQQFTGGGGAGGGSAGGGGSAMASAGPWVALAAAIAANEWQSDQAGRRGDSNGEHLRMALTGEGLSNDMEYYGDKVGGPIGKMIEIGGDMGSLRDAPKRFEKMLKPWEWF